jgi:hemoglobin-like flavoprotein
MLTSSQVRLVQSSWEQVLPIQQQAAALFYAKLFELDPALKSLFKGDMLDQGRKLTPMITAAVNGIAQVEELRPVVESLGRRHAGYGVTDAHYDTVGVALLWTLEQGLGSAFTPEVKVAWATTYAQLAATMRETKAAA